MPNKCYNYRYDFRLGRFLLLLLCILFCLASSIQFFYDFGKALRSALIALNSDILNYAPINYCIYYTITTVIAIVACLFILIKAKSIYCKKLIIRDEKYVRYVMTSPDDREPAIDRDMLKARIYGKKRVPRSESQMIDMFIDSNVEPIRNYFSGQITGTLVINAKWGAGKTTNLLMAINEVSGKFKNRYIYESVFKYRIKNGEFTKDLLATLSEVMEELGIKVPRQIYEIAENLDTNIEKTTLNVLRSKKEINALTSGLIADINAEYENKELKNKIFIIIDDLDRLRGEDIEVILSLLSTIRRLIFVRIIIPADVETVQKALGKIGVIEPAIFADKYLPSERSTHLKSAYDLTIEVLSKQILSQNRGRDINSVNPAISAIFIKILAKKMNNLTLGFTRYRHAWLSIPGDDSLNIDQENEQILQILRIPRIIYDTNKQDNYGYFWATNYNNIRSVQNIVYALFQAVNGVSRGVRNNFTDQDYYYVAESWIFRYMKRRWDIFGFSLRDALDTLSSVNFGNLPNGQAEQFAYVYNQLFPNERIKFWKESNSSE